MGASDTDRAMHECQHCGNVSFDNPATDSYSEDLTAMEETPVKDPELAVVLREVFGISETGLQVCLCLMEEGESTAGDLAERLDIDRSTVGRQVNHLTDVGVLEKRNRLLKNGGYVHVYSPVDVEEVRQRLTGGVYAWASEALELIEDINREKVNALARRDSSTDEGTTQIFWDK